MVGSRLGGLLANRASVARKLAIGHRKLAIDEQGGRLSRWNLNVQCPIPNVQSANFPSRVGSISFNSHRPCGSSLTSQIAYPGVEKRSPIFNIQYVILNIKYGSDQPLSRGFGLKSIVPI
jgi:hypothetical protein